MLPVEHNGDGFHYVVSYQRHLRGSGDEHEVVTKVGVVSIASIVRALLTRKWKWTLCDNEGEGRFSLRRFIPATLARKWRRA